MGTPARGQKFTPAQGRRPRAGVNFWPRAGVPTPSRGQVKEVPFQEFSPFLISQDCRLHLQNKQFRLVKLLLTEDTIIIH